MSYGQNEYVPFKKRTKLSGWMITECACGTRPGNSVVCPVVNPFTTQVERTSTNSYRIPTGCRTHKNRTNRTGTGQTAYLHTSNVHLPDIFIRRRPFEVLNMSKTCQRIGPDKTDITWHGTHSPHKELTRNACERTRTADNFTVRYASVSAIR